MKKHNEKDIDNILSEYVEAVGTESDKSRDLGRLYAKENKKRKYRRPIIWRAAPVCVAAVLICAILVSVPLYEWQSHGYGGPLFGYDGGITASSSASQNKGGFFDSVSSWLDSLRGDKGNKDNGNKNDGQSGSNGADGSTGTDGADGSSDITGGDETITFESAIAQDVPAREFFKGLITPKINCKSVEITKPDVGGVASVSNRYSVTLTPKESKLQRIDLYYVCEDVVMGKYAHYKEFPDKLFWKGTTVSYKITEVNGGFLYSVHFNLGSVDCYIDLLAEEGCDIEEVMTETFG